VKTILHRAWRAGLLAALLAIVPAPCAFAQSGADADKQKWREILERPALTSGFPQSLAETYLQRAEAARALEDSERELRELEAGLKLIGNTGPGMWLWFRLSSHYGDRGNFVKALAVMETLRKTAASNGMKNWEHFGLAVIMAYKAGMYDRAGAAASLKELLSVQAELRRSRFWPEWGNLWQTQSAWATGIYQLYSGHPADAEASFQACLASFKQHAGGSLRAEDAQSFYAVDCSTILTSALRLQGKLAEAGAVAAQYREFLQAFAQAHRRPGIVSRTALAYAPLAMEQGHYGEARKIIESATEQLLGAGAGKSSVYLSGLRGLHALIEMIEGNWAKAESIHKARADGVRGERQGNISAFTANWAYTLVRLGRAKEAVDMMRGVVQRQQEMFDENSLILWDSRAFLGVALAAAGQREAALKELTAAVPKVLELANGERSSADSGVVRAKRLGWMLDGYLGLLSDIVKAGEAAPIDVVNEAFRMADLARGSTVQRALAASASRANVADPALAELIRKEQDLQREISSLADAIGNLLSRGRLAEQDKIVADMRANLEKMRAQQAQTLRDLQRDYPEFASLIDPKPLGIADIQKALKPNEAMVSIYVGSDRTLVWAIPAQGKPAFAVAALNEAQVAGQVKKLRRALDPAAGVPAYDFDTAFELYTQLLAPVQAGWNTAQELILVPHGVLGSLPFSVLTTAPFKPKESAMQFNDYAAAPWLLRQVAISQLPAALAIAALRGKGQSKVASRAFLGFGDPVFSASGAVPQSGGNRSVARRNLHIAATEQQVQDMAGKADLSLLQALPDTAAEIEDIAKVLKADTARDVFLQKRASEGNVKSRDISDYRVVMFATHGLVPGEMPGMYQPALALSHPALTGDKEDGFLTMEEILGLRLQADWVVLSACNTASPSGGGSEAVSGLGRAFFYAGAKALLVSSWPVETVSARLLTTDIFRRQSENSGISRAGALREASLDLIKRGTPAYSYAHPMFWAPFIIVGDGG
jgi:CHAT domain-containing protein